MPSTRSPLASANMTTINPTRLYSIADNLTNGNLKDAKELAKPFSVKRLALSFVASGNGVSWSVLTARYLKGVCTWQQYCDNVKATHNGVLFSL